MRPTLQRPWAIWALSTLLSASLSSVASAQVRNVPIGGRTATMGGAGTAAGNDSAMPYLNPAGEAGLPGDVLAVSATVYSYETRRAPGIFHPNGFPSYLGPGTVVTDALSSSTTGELPSSVLYFKELPPLAPTISQRLGMSLVIPYAERVELVGNFTGTFPATASTLKQSLGASLSTTDYYFGPTYAVAFGDRLRLGATLDTLYVAQNRQIDYASVSLVASGSLPVELRAQHAETSWSLGLVPILGAQLRLASNLWIGVGAAAPSVHLLGSLTNTNQSSGNLVDLTTLTSTAFSQTTAINGASHTADRPMRINVGLAYDDRASWSVAADASLYLARSGAVQSSGTQSGAAVQSGDVARQYSQAFSSSFDVAQGFAFSVGGELVVSPLVALRAGAFYDTTNQPSDAASSLLYVFRMDRVGGTLGIGLRIGSFDTTLGGVYSHGMGSIVSQDTSQSSVPFVFTDATADTFMAVLSGAVTVVEAKRTIEKTLNVPEPLQ